MSIAAEVMTEGFSSIEKSIFKKIVFNEHWKRYQKSL